MSERAPIVDMSGSFEENVVQLGKHLGKNKVRRMLFNAVYGRGTRPRSKKQLMRAAHIAERDAQQVQNELDHLAKHHLIVRLENVGIVNDGSRYVYRKDPSVRANRQRIVKHADNLKEAAKVPTKRRPLIRGMSPVKLVVVRQTLRKRKRLSVLYLTANPDETNPIRVDAEVRQVQNAVRGSVYRDSISLEYRPAADLESLIEGLNDLRPRVVHFSGHGYDDGIAVDSSKVGKRPTRTVSFELLAKALSATDKPPEVVVLNSCKSAGARRSLLPSVKIIIVMRKSVSDLAATAFAAKFYAAIAAGQSVMAAYAQGKLAVEMVSLNEVDTPELLAAPGVDPSKVTLT